VDLTKVTPQEHWHLERPSSRSAALLAGSLSRGPVLRKAFGWFLVAFGVSFTIYRVTRR
jgi:hypothetical protein